MDYFELVKQYETDYMTFECIPTALSKVTNSIFSYAVVQEYYQHEYIAIGNSKEDLIKKLEKLKKDDHVGHYKFKIPRSCEDLQEINDIHELSKGTRFKFVRSAASHKFTVFFSCDGDAESMLEKLKVMYPEDGVNIKYNKSLKEVIKSMNKYTFYFMEMSFMFNDIAYVDILPFFLSEHNIRLNKIHIQVNNLEEAKYYMDKLT